MILHPSIISHMAMKMLRLLKSRSDNPRREVEDGRRKATKRYDAAMTHRAMALPTLRILFMVWCINDDDPRALH